MEERHRMLLRCHQVYLVRELDLKTDSEVFWAHLDADEIITNNMREQIETARTKQAIASEFIRILMMRGPRAFDSFIRALRESSRTHIADHLLAHV
jgi:hypothetical protein